METNHLVKVSVFLPEPLHLDLKRQALDQRTSLQRVISEKITSDSSVPTAAPSGAAGSNVLDRRAISRWKLRLHRILEGQNLLAIRNCTAAIETAEAFMSAAGVYPPPRTEESSGGMQV